jgi:hypothetical protein
MTDAPSTPNTATEVVPSRLDDHGPPRRGITRRTGRAGRGRDSIGSSAGPILGGGGRSVRARPPAATTATSRRLRDANGNLISPGPYSMQASCELSQDWFQTSEIVIGPNDQVVPFVNPKNNNTVEAVVYAAGTLCHLRRDASATSGWAYETVDLQGVLSDVTDFAVAANATDVYLLAFGDPGDFNDNPNGDPAWLTTLDGPDSWDYGTTVSYDDLQWTPTGPVSIKGGIDPGGACYFYTSLVDGDTTYLLGWVAGGAGAGTYLNYQQYLTLDTTSVSVSDYIVLFDSKATAPTGYALVFASNGDLSVYPEIAYTSQTNDSFSPDPLTNAGAQDVTTLLWAWATPGSQTGAPGYAVQQSTGTALVDENGNYNQLWDTNSVAQDQATVWLQDGLYTVSLLDGNGAVNIVQELSSSGTGSWAAALPLTTIPDGFATIYSVPTDPSEATIFAVGVDETLSVLSLDQSGWTQTQVHQDGAQLLEIDSYRVQASVLDANGAGVGLASVQVSTDRPVGFWQASGNTAVTPAGPVTMTADGAGQITFSVPAEELDCAVLTMQALDSDSNPSGAAFTVTPDTDVQSFLGGTGSLLGVGPMSSTTLLSAKTAAGDPLFTGLTSLPSDQQTSAATAVAGACNQLITVGMTAAPSGPSATQAMLIDVSQATPVIQTSTNPNAYSIASVEAELQLSFSHLFDTLGHALRHAAVTLKKTVVRWAEDAGSWIVDLAVQIGDDIVSFTDLVISDMKDAFHVIGGFFQALGADIVGAIDWLKHNVIELIQDADANAKVIQGWYTPFLATLTDAISTIKIDADTFFTNLQTNADAQIGKLATTIEDDTFGASTPLPPPTHDTGSHDADLLFKVGSDVITFMRHSPANWLLHKMREHLPRAPSDGGPNFSDLDAALEQVIQDLVADVADTIDLIESINTLLWDAVKPFLIDAGKFNESSMGDFFTALETTTNDALTLINQMLITGLDAIGAAVAALKDLLSYQYQAVPVIGDLLELCGVDTTLSVARIVSLIAAYPTTLINQIIGGGPLFPADNTPPTGNSLTADQAPSIQLSNSERVDGWGVGLNWTSAVVQAIWSFNDLLLDDGAAVAAGGSKYGFKANSLTTILDIVCPMAITMLQYPSPTTAGGLTQPFWAGTNDKGDGTDLIPWMLFTSFIPPATEIFYVVADAKGIADAADYNDYGVPTFCAIAGVANTVLSSIYGHDQGVPIASIAFGVLANVSYDVAPLGYPALNDLFEDTPAIAKLIVDAIANFGTSIAMSSQAIAAALKPLLARIPL